jgi:FkbM family methyltransferase
MNLKNNILFALWMLTKPYGFQNLLHFYLKRGKIKFPNNFSITINKNNFRDILQLYRFSVIYGVNINNRWKVNEQNYTITTPCGLKFSLEGFDALIFAETFLYDSHFIDFDLTGKIVIHAGAYVGETALYYAKRGAIVYAFEPNPDCYRIASLNLKLNPELAKNIVLENYAIGEDGYTEFPNIKCNGGASVYSSIKDKVKVRSVSISTILKEFKISNPDILDIDIKGGEFKVIHDKSLEKFKIIRIEYITEIEGKKLGSVDDIINKLREYGFNKIRIYKHNEMEYDLSEHGTIYAVK